MEFANGRQGKTCDVSVSYSTRQYIVVVFTKSKVDDHHKKKEKKSNRRERPRHRDSAGMLATGP